MGIVFEKVNPKHPDKVADRIAGAILDKVNSLNGIAAVEVLIGHNKCFIINETSVNVHIDEIANIVKRITGSNMEIKYVEVPQDVHLADNQKESDKCGDNGIFKGVHTSIYEQFLTDLASLMYQKFDSDGKYVYAENKLIICQSNASESDINEIVAHAKSLYPKIEINEVIINPLGKWTGGTDVDSGATNRKLGSDMGRGVTGGGLHGKDLSKTDLSVNIYNYIKAQETYNDVESFCAIGNEYVFYGDTKIKYTDIKDIAKQYIDIVGGYEKFAEWGLIRPLV